MVLKYRAADLFQFPSVLQQGCKHVSVGDLHGNTLKLIYILIEERIFELDKARYETLRDVYMTPVELLTRADLNLFQCIIEDLVVSSNKALTLIGDELADRGNNDYFTLLVLKKLHTAQVNIEIALSNHSIEFIRDYENNYFSGQHYLGQDQGQSLTHMHYLIARGLVDEDEIRAIRHIKIWILYGANLL